MDLQSAWLSLNVTVMKADRKTANITASVESTLSTEGSSAADGQGKTGY
jgi:hypothetical protein